MILLVSCYVQISELMLHLRTALRDLVQVGLQKLYDYNTLFLSVSAVVYFLQVQVCERDKRSLFLSLISKYKQSLIRHFVPGHC